MGVFMRAATVDAASIHLAWDPSPTPGVIGYRVHVGTASRLYTEIYDVGQATWFFYEGAPGRRYYFAVAGYLSGPVVGPLSKEVSGYATDTPPVSTRAGAADLTALRGMLTDTALEPHDRFICAELSARDCFDVRQIADSPGEITSLALLPDGRLMFIEDGRRVRILVGDRLLSESALEIGPSVRLTHIAVDPAFPLSGFIFIGVVETRADEGREMHVVRFRMVQNQLGEAATIVTGLPLGASRDAPFVVDTQGNLYVALPAADDSARGRRDLFSGMILRFNAEGAVPRDNPTASPVLAHGYAHPVALEWEAGGQRLWLSGTGPRFPQPLAYLEVAAPEPREWPRVPRPASIGTSTSTLPPFAPGGIGVALRMSSPRLFMLFPTDREGDPQPGHDRSSPEFSHLILGALGVPSAIASGPSGHIYIALRAPPVVPGSDTFSVLKLQPQR